MLFHCRALTEAYVEDVVSSFENFTFPSGPSKGGKVIMLWDVMNQPDSSSQQLHQFVLNMTTALKADESVNRTLTCVVLPGGSASDWNDAVDVFSFANYNGKRGAVAGAGS